MNYPDSPHQQLLGLFELDQAGTILYARLDHHNNNKGRDLRGLNFFSEVAIFKNVDDFRRRLDEFTSGPHKAHSFNLTCHFEGGELSIKVLVARMHERTNGERRQSILVHIRPA